MEKRRSICVLGLYVYFTVLKSVHMETPTLKKRLIRFCNTDQSRTDKARRKNNLHTWKRSLNCLIENCKVKTELAIRNLTEESICSKMPSFIGYSGKYNMRNAKKGQNEFSNITFYSGS